jgi:hypothetical protein
VVWGGVDGAGVVWAGVDGAATVVAVGAGVFLAVDVASATDTFGVRLLARGCGVDDEEELAAAMPTTKTSPQHTRNPASTLCLAVLGFRPYPRGGCWP